MPTALSDNLLAKCTLFRGMNPAERQELGSLLEFKSYAAGETILAEGESFQIMWIVLKGRCQVVKTLKSGEEIELGVIEPCGVFGEMSFFHPAPHSATVRALSDVDVVRLPRDKYEVLTRDGSLAAYKLAFNTMGVLIERLRRMDESIDERMKRNNAAAHKEEWMDFQTKLYTGWTF
jgi:CRP-like cAMP-binding protein